MARREPKWLRKPKTPWASHKHPSKTRRLRVVKAKHVKGAHAAKDKRRAYLISTRVKRPHTAAKARQPVKVHTPKDARAAYQPKKAKGLKPDHKRRK